MTKDQQKIQLSEICNQERFKISQRFYLVLESLLKWRDEEIAIAEKRYRDACAALDAKGAES